MKIKKTVYNLILPIAKLYWYIFKPQSFGARVLIIHPQDPNKVLLVLHSYGNSTLWNIPGGGYKPKKESADAAAKREVFEELGVEITNLSVLGEYQTTGEGKIDTVTMFSGTVIDVGDICLNHEISQLAWVEQETIGSRGDDVARVARRAVEAHFNAL